MSIVEDVREAVIAIPARLVASYGEIGRRIGAGPRQVGRAMSMLDDSVPLVACRLRRRNTRLVLQRTGTGATRRGGDTDAGCTGGHETGPGNDGCRDDAGINTLVLNPA